MDSHFERAVERAVSFGNRRARRDRLAAARKFLKRCGWEDFGVEHVSTADHELTYLNQGDTYALTVCQEGNGELFASTWGDWVEEIEREYEQETDTIRCGYCGEFTPLCAAAMSEPPGARHSWRETVCESCGHHVDGST